MSIRFKFRSSAFFDSVDLEGRPSISVRELRLKIIRNKNLNICQDFDLVFSDSVTGEEYNDENFQIRSGACIIVKRVPAGTVPSANAVRAVMINGFAKQGSDDYIPASVKVNNVDDFGTDMCLHLGKLLNKSEPECNEGDCCDFVGADLPSSRFDCQNLESSDLSQAIHKGSNHSMGEPNLVQEARNEDKKFKKVLNSNSFAMEHADLPVELKCPLCNTFFKEAVLIPCCQHSFCKKCITFDLLEKKACPICFSTKCSVNDLLPNLSLRQAIDHFLGSQVLGTGSPNDLCQQLVPDGESGIQAKDMSYAVTVIQREPEMPHSPSATGHGSNQVLAESFYDSLRRSSPRKMHLFDGQRFQYAHDEAESTMQRTGRPLVNTGGVETNFWSTGRHKQVGRNCYICGSLEHLMRDCPASNPHPMPQTGNHMLMGGIPGYPPPYWNNTLYSPMSPFTNMYGSPGMMPFSASIIPTATFSASPYMPIMHSGVPLNGVMRKDGMTPLMGNKTERLSNQHEFMELQHHNSRRNVPDQNLDMFRGKQCDYKERFENKHLKDREASTSNSEDSFGRRSKRKRLHVDRKPERSPQSFSAGRDRALLHTERSNSNSEDIGHNREKREHHRRDTRKIHERRGHGGSDSSRGHHHASKEDCKRLVHDVRGSHQKHAEFSDSGSPRNQRVGGKEKDSRHNRHNSKHHGKELRDERWKLDDVSYGDCGADYHHYKRKRDH